MSSKICESNLFYCKLHVSCLEVCYTEDKMVQNVCRLCLILIKTEKERQRTEDYLEIQATKIKFSNKSNLILRHLQALQSVFQFLKLTEEEHAISVLSIIMENKTSNELCLLETRNGQIKKLYCRSQSGICEQELISMEFPNIETILLSVEATQSCGIVQGFKVIL